MRNLPVVLSALTLVLLVAALVFGANVLGGPAVIGEQGDLKYDEVTARLALLLDSVDQIVAMLTTISIGLAVVVGVALREFWSKRKRLKPQLAIASVGFVISLFSSFFYGFGARQQAFEFVVFGHLDFLSLKDLFIMQAASVGVEAAMAFYMLVSAFVRDAGQTVEQPRISGSPPKSPTLPPSQIVAQPTGAPNA